MKENKLVRRNKQKIKETFHSQFLALSLVPETHICSPNVEIAMCTCCIGLFRACLCSDGNNWALKS